MKLSACIEDKYMFAEHADIPARIRAARAAGLDLVEFHLWLDRDIDAIERALRETHITLASLVVNPRCGNADASKQEFFLQSMQGSIAMAARLQARAIVAAGGPAVPGATDAAQHEAMVASLKRIGPVAEKAGVQIWLEPLNTRVDHPGMYMTSARQGLDIIEEVHCPAVRLLYDVYHSTIMGESHWEVLKRAPLIGYIQVADTNGRHEPGSGTIDWADFMTALKASGYQGDIGMEYRPSADTLSSLAQTHRILGI